MEKTLNFASCELYGIKKIKELETILGFSSREFTNQKNIIQKHYRVYINKDNRLIEAPNNNIKRIQTKIKI